MSAAAQRTRVAAIYARVSSERQRQEQTIQSQTAALHELACERALVVPDGLVFEDEGFSGASLQRPALERLRDRAAEGAFDVLLCHAPDRLARRYAYQVLLLEELARAGVQVCFAKEPEHSGSPEDELLRQFQGMIAEYERAQIAERTRRGKQHRARQGSQAVLSAAPYGYRYVKKTDHCDAYYKIDEAGADVVRQIFGRYSNEGVSIGALTRWLSEAQIETRTGKQTWDRSTVWGMLRNPAYRGEAEFGKTASSGQPGKATRTTRQRGERHGRRPTRTDRPAEQWTVIAVPAIVDEQTFALAQARLQDNKRFAVRNTKDAGTAARTRRLPRLRLRLLPQLDAHQRRASHLLLPLHRLGRLAPPRWSRLRQPPCPRRRARRPRLDPDACAARRPHPDPGRDRPTPERTARRAPRRAPPRRAAARRRR
jgi:site-specific DNA recombinase